MYTYLCTSKDKIVVVAALSLQSCKQKLKDNHICESFVISNVTPSDKEELLFVQIR